MKKNIAVICGGDSGEYEISIKSATVVKNNLNPKLFHVFPILITKKKWVFINENQQEVIVDKNDFSIIINEKKIKFNCVFNVIHGTPGEDGKLQGYFDMLGIPYTSCDLITSAVTFNKMFSKIIASDAGVKSAKYVLLKKNEKIDVKEICSKIAFPFFVKPNKNGSSVGVSRVNKMSELKPAIEKAFNDDDEILIEEFIDGKEITNGAFRFKGKLIIFPITEIIPKNVFFDYEAKYQKGMSQEITPARISKSLETKVKSVTAKLYNTFNCKGFIRIDYIIKLNQPYFLEVNTVPGLSEQSIIPQQANVLGIHISELFTMAIQEAIE